MKNTHFFAIISWRCTVHKTQDLSFKNTVVKFYLLKQENFSYSQVYIALIWVKKKLTGLHFDGLFTVNAIETNTRVWQEYNTSHSTSITRYIANLKYISRDLEITLLNIKSSKMNVIDLGTDMRLIAGDFIWFH